MVCKDADFATVGPHRKAGERPKFSREEGYSQYGNFNADSEICVKTLTLQQSAHIVKLVRDQNSAKKRVTANMVILTQIQRFVGFKLCFVGSRI